MALRDLRLRALADAPAAFEMTLPEAKRRTDEDWRQRFASSDDRFTFVEDGANGRLVGMAFGFFDPGTRAAYLGGMFVEPANRGAGVGRTLVGAIVGARVGRCASGAGGESRADGGGAAL